jgi:hypothetical protein
MHNIADIMIGVAAVILGFFFLWALVLGMKELGRQFRSYKAAAKVTLSPEEASEYREAIDAYRMLKKAEKAADAVKKA